MSSSDHESPANEPSLTMEIRGSLADVDKSAWNALSTENNPFVRYEFLHEEN